MATGPANVSFDVEAHAKIGGSVRIRPDTDKNISEWVTEGSWPGEATGSAHVAPVDAEFALDGAIWCSLPRVELHTQLFGVVGPVAIIAPTAVLDKDGFHPELRFSAGVTASLSLPFGASVGNDAGIEVPVYNIKF
jgi:hypothetical protein